MVLNKKFYLWALLLAMLFMLAAFTLAKLYDDAKIASIDNSVRALATESEETRILLQYGQLFGSQDKIAFCEALDYSRKKNLDKGYSLVNALKTFEKANLLAQYEQVRRQYYLNNAELWLQTSTARKECVDQNSTVALFFTETLTTCVDCTVQGEILDQLRGSCPNLEVITLASDLNIGPIELAKKQFGVSGTPAIVINNAKTLQGVKTREELARELGCTSK